MLPWVGVSKAGWRNDRLPCPTDLTLGLKQMDVKDWLEIDETYLERYRLKKQLFESNRDDIIQILDGVEGAAFEGLELLVDYLSRRYPSIFRMISRSVIENVITGDIWDVDRSSSVWEKFHPLQVMSLLATEDFLIMQTDAEGKSSLRAGVVCFPGT
jgi:hypothetical protein